MTGRLFLFSVLLGAVLVSVLQSLNAQVIIYPIVAVHAKATTGSYRDADQKEISHMSTEVAYLPTWSSSWSFLYRRSGLEYSTGFQYEQNHFVVSTTHVLPFSESFLILRSDVAYVTSNSALTNQNVTLFGELDYSTQQGWNGLSLKGFYSHFEDVKSVGAGAGFWTGLGRYAVMSLGAQIVALSGTYRDGERLVFGSASLYVPVSQSVGLLTAGGAGRRSMFYEPAIKLVYNTLDANSLQASETVFLSLGKGVSLLADATYERFDAFGGGSYGVLYLTGGISVRL